MSLVVLVHFGSLGVLYRRLKTQYQTQKVIFFKVGVLWSRLKTQYIFFKVLNAKKRTIVINLHFFVHCLPKIAHMWTQLHVKISRIHQAIGGAH